MKKLFMTILNLQMFAVQTTLLNSPSNDLSPENKTFYDKALIREAQAQLVHDQFGQRRPIPKNGGKTIEFRKFSPLPKATTPLTEGVTPAGNKLNVTTVTAQVAQYGDFVELSDFLQLTAIDNVVLETTELCGNQGGLTLDTITRDVLQGGTNVLYAPKVVGGVETEVLSRSDLDATAKLTVDVVKQAAAILKAQNAPKINGYYVSIIHPYAAYDLMSDPEWIDAHKYDASEELFTGEIGRVGGVRFVEATEAKIYRGADLASDSRSLKVNGAVSAGTSITFDGGTVAKDALVGRYILVGGTRVKVTANTTTTMTVDAAVTAADNADIYPGEGGADGVSVFGTMFLGKDAYGITEIEGGGMQTIIKQLGSAGSADPLDQRSTIGWKANKAAERLVENYMLRVEHVSGRYNDVAAN